MGATYKGRFAPSPTGPLHAGSLVAALASWLDARAHCGQWLVRIEDVDTPRCIEGMGATILAQLATLGLQADEEPVWQSRRTALYQSALDKLIEAGMAYPCHCSRKDVELALAASGRERVRGGELVYPGTCRMVLPGPHGLRGHVAPAWRLRTDGGDSTNQPAPAPVQWLDRRLAAQSQDVAQAVGDFPLKRADGCFTYQLAVVADDAAQGVTHVVRGEDLADNTPRQILLQRALHLPSPHYLHTPLVRGVDGEKLSKQNGAAALNLASPATTLAALNGAAVVLGLPPSSASGIQQALSTWAEEWRGLYN